MVEATEVVSCVCRSGCAGWKKNDGGGQLSSGIYGRCGEGERHVAGSVGLRLLFAQVKVKARTSGDRAATPLGRADQCFRPKWEWPCAFPFLWAILQACMLDWK